MPLSPTIKTIRGSLMTTVVAITSKKRTVITADSQLTLGNRKTFNGMKIIVRPPFVFGVCGDLRAINVIANDLNVYMPRDHYEFDADFYVNNILLQKIRHAFKETGYGIVSENKELHGSSFVVFYKGKLFEIGSDYAVCEITDYTTIGSGGDFAMGYLVGASRSNTNIADKAIRAVEVASELDTYTGGEIVIFDSNVQNLVPDDEYFDTAELLYNMDNTELEDED